MPSGSVPILNKKIWELLIWEDYSEPRFWWLALVLALKRCLYKNRGNWKSHNKIKIIQLCLLGNTFLLTERFIQSIPYIYTPYPLLPICLSFNLCLKTAAHNLSQAGKAGYMHNLSSNHFPAVKTLASISLALFKLHIKWSETQNFWTSQTSSLERTVL